VNGCVARWVVVRWVWWMDVSVVWWSLVGRVDGCVGRWVLLGWMCRRWVVVGWMFGMIFRQVRGV